MYIRKTIIMEIIISHLETVMLHVQAVTRLLSVAKLDNKMQYMLSNKAITIPILHTKIYIADVIIHTLKRVYCFR